jgi:thioredoxin-related protein
MNKKISLSILMLFFSIATFGQHWLTNFDKAKEIASTENKPIILVFQGSDWCTPCIKLDREIWSTDEFIEYADSHFVMLQADFPKKKQNALDEAQQTHNNKLAEAYNKNGYFPFVVLLDKNGNEMGSTGYKKIPPSEYISLLASFYQ